jgi:hypothetical protein
MKTNKINPKPKKNTPSVSTHWQPSSELRAWQVLASCNPKEISVSQKNIPLQRGFGDI